MRACVVVVLLGACASAPPAPPSNRTAQVIEAKPCTTLTGIVVGAGGNDPIAGATVVVSGNTEHVPEGAQTDEHGRFSFEAGPELVDLGVYFDDGIFRAPRPRECRHLTLVIKPDTAPNEPQALLIR